MDPGPPHKKGTWGSFITQSNLKAEDMSHHFFVCLFSHLDKTKTIEYATLSQLANECAGNPVIFWESGGPVSKGQWSLSREQVAIRLGRTHQTA